MPTTAASALYLAYVSAAHLDYTMAARYVTNARCLLLSVTEETRYVAHAIYELPDRFKDTTVPGPLVALNLRVAIIVPPPEDLSRFMHNLYTMYKLLLPEIPPALLLSEAEEEEVERQARKANLAHEWSKLMDTREAGLRYSEDRIYTPPPPRGGGV